IEARRTGLHRLQRLALHRCQRSAPRPCHRRLRRPCPRRVPRPSHRRCPRPCARRVPRPARHQLLRRSRRLGRRRCRHPNRHRSGPLLRHHLPRRDRSQHPWQLSRRVGSAHRTPSLRGTRRSSAGVARSRSSRAPTREGIRRRKKEPAFACAPPTLVDVDTFCRRFEVGTTPSCACRCWWGQSSFL
ncbi:MAG: hypothetical protein INH37_20830, partial [Myxococcaceae bacterium]|nr:hypothetical protein [Myxococcaceae bacterium]